MKLKLFAIAVAALSMSACVSTKTYVDPQYSDVSYTDLTIPQGTEVSLSTEFFTNGKPNSKATKELSKYAEKILTKAGVKDVAGAPKLVIIADNIVDMDEATAKGFGTGLTLGMAGSLVTDGYDFKFSYADSSGEVTKNYKHALHTTIGNKEAPVQNVEALPLAAAFEAMLEDVILSFLNDLEADGKIASNTVIKTYSEAALFWVNQTQLP